jgi:hypothetical protein
LTSSRFAGASLLLTPLVLGAAALMGPGAVADDQPPTKCNCSGTVLHRSIPIQKLPSEVEGQNKIHVRLMPGKDSTGVLTTMSVLGKALYPDGVKLLVRLRHRKSTEAFMTQQVVTEQGLFQAHFGPLNKRTIPGGGLVAEVWFVTAQQTKEMQAKLLNDKWYHSSPPCIHDTCNYYSLPYSMGGCDAEDESEKDEKVAMEAARKQIVNARDLANAAFKGANAGAAGAALAKVTGDLETVKTTFNAWASTRLFLLFPKQAGKLKLLSTLVLNEARANAAIAGAAVEGLTADKAPAVLKQSTEDANRVADELKGFASETGSLDKLWDEAQAVAAKAASNPATPEKK